LRQLSALEKYRGGMVAYFLNRDLAEYQEIGPVRQVLETCQELHTLFINRPAPLPSPEWRAYEFKKMQLAIKVNEAARQFEVVFGLDVFGADITPVCFLAHSVSSAKHKPMMAQMTKTGARVFGPHTAIQVILEMTGASIVDRIRRCDNPGCHKWIMVTNAKRVTCSDACRFAKYQIQKNSRANDMRRSRELHKNHPHLKRQSSTRPAKTAKRKTHKGKP
jgi:hypothetical protein